VHVSTDRVPFAPPLHEAPADSSRLTVLHLVTSPSLLDAICRISEGTCPADHAALGDLRRQYVQGVPSTGHFTEGMFSSTAHQTHGGETANKLNQRAKGSVAFGRQSLSKAISVMCEEGCHVNHVSTKYAKTHIAASGASVPSAKIRQLQDVWVSVQVLVEGVSAADIMARR
jgi:hypothetical protein